MLTVTMNQPNLSAASVWPWWRLAAFRFFFIYIALQIAPITWLNMEANVISDYYLMFIDWLVALGNEHLFHVRKTLVPLNGSGDTSYSWAQLLLFLTIALAGSILWWLLDRKRKSYNRLDYWLRTFVRYFLILVSVSYGASKLFALQMPYPSQSLMATPLGELLPMRLSWVFMGYSSQYQFFAGLLELLTGILLLFRRTITLGLILGTAVYLNVVLLNLSYDIPVKIFAIHYLFYCLFLLAYQYRRLITFFFSRQPALPDTSYDVHYPKKWMRVSKHLAKGLFVFFLVIGPLVLSYEEYQMLAEQTPSKFNGVYNVRLFVLNADTLQYGDQRRWNDVIFDGNDAGSVGTKDSLFRQKYGRGYFLYMLDTVAQKITFQKMAPNYDVEDIFDAKYSQTDTATIAMVANVRNNKLYIELVRHDRHFPLAENQFHWLSENNR
jgi:hypothetical protein